MSFTPADKQRAAHITTWISVVVNLILVILQIVVGVWAKSQSLIADGLHSLSDLLADFVVLFVNRFSHADPDQRHPYGHARFETAASLFLGTILLVAGLGMLWSAAEKIQHPETIAAVHVAALWVALFTLAAKEILFRYMLRIAKQVQSNMLIANAWHARSDAASSLVVAAGIAGNLAGYTFLDPLAAALVGFMIARTGGKFAWQALSDLMDQSVDDNTVQTIEQTLAATSGVLGVHDLRTRKMGDQALVDAHILVNGKISVSEGHRIAALARQRVKQQCPTVLDVLVHIDPEDDEGTSACLQLPDRSEIEALLQVHLGEDAAHIECLLHYLAGQLSVVLLLPATINPTDELRLSALLAALKNTNGVAEVICQRREW